MVREPVRREQDDVDLSQAKLGKREVIDGRGAPQPVMVMIVRGTANCRSAVAFCVTSRGRGQSFLF